MSGALPELVDAWRMVTAGRIFAGRLPLATMTRLAESLADSDGEVAYDLHFSRDDFGIGYIDMRLQTRLPLTCQRSLERFEFPVDIAQRLGLIASERDEAGLPEGYEPVLLETSAEVNLAALIEDELILALPIVPLKEGMDDKPPQTWSTGEPDEDELQEPDTVKNPFAALASLKQDRS